MVENAGISPQNSADKGISVETISNRINYLKDDAAKVEAARFSLHYLLAKGRPNLALSLLRQIDGPKLPFNEGEQNRILNGILGTADRLLAEDPIEAFDAVRSVAVDREVPFETKFSYETYKKLDQKRFEEQKVATLARFIECFLNPDIEVKGRKRFGVYDLKSLINFETQSLRPYHDNFDRVVDSLSESARKTLLAGDYLPDHTKKRLQELKGAELQRKLKEPVPARSTISGIEAASKPIDLSQNPYAGLNREQLANKCRDDIKSIVQGTIPNYSVGRFVRSLFSSRNEVGIETYAYESIKNDFKNPAKQVELLRILTYFALSQDHNVENYSYLLYTLKNLNSADLPFEPGECTTIANYGLDHILALYSEAKIGVMDIRHLLNWGISAMRETEDSGKRLLSQEDLNNIDVKLKQVEEKTLQLSAKMLVGVLEKSEIKDKDLFYIADILSPNRYGPENTKRLFKELIFNRLSLSLREKLFALMPRFVEVADRYFLQMLLKEQQSQTAVSSPMPIEPTGPATDRLLEEKSDDRKPSSTAEETATRENVAKLIKEVPDSEEGREERIKKLFDTDLTDEQEQEALLAVYARAKEFVDKDDDNFFTSLIGYNQEIGSSDSWHNVLSEIIERTQDPKLKAKLVECYIDASLLLKRDLRHLRDLYKLTVFSESLPIADFPVSPEYGNFLWEMLYSRLLETYQFMDAFRMGNAVVDKGDKILRPEENNRKIRNAWVNRMGMALKAWSEKIVDFQNPGVHGDFQNYCIEFRNHHPKEFSKLYRSFSPKTQAFLKESGLNPKGFFQNLLRK